MINMYADNKQSGQRERQRPKSLIRLYGERGGRSCEQQRESHVGDQTGQQAGRQGTPA